MITISNINLCKAKFVKNDEFYTQYEDIEKELSNYTKHFYNKTIYCNCDNPKFSNFIKYFVDNFEILHLKKLICTYLSDNTDNSPAVATVFYNLKDFETIPLKGNGDFMSPECLAFLNNADIIVTNPPFSKAGQFLELLFNYNKKFLIIGHLNLIGYKNLFSKFKNNEFWFGYNSVNKFLIPEGGTKTFGNIYWYTNLTVSKNNKEIELTEYYSPEKYPKYNNYDAINVDKVSQIPKDYNGIMGVPLSFVTKFCPQQFEIIGMDINNLVEELNIKPMGKEWVDTYKKQGGTAHYSPNMHTLCFIKDGRAYVKYRRILIKKKK